MSSDCPSNQTKGNWEKRFCFSHFHCRVLSIKRPNLVGCELFPCEATSSSLTRSIVHIFNVLSTHDKTFLSRASKCFVIIDCNNNFILNTVLAMFFLNFRFFLYIRHTIDKQKKKYYISALKSKKVIKTFNFIPSCSHYTYIRCLISLV